MLLARRLGQGYGYACRDLFLAPADLVPPSSWDFLVVSSVVCWTSSQAHLLRGEGERACHDTPCNL